MSVIPVEWEGDTLTKIMIVSQDMGQQHELENLANTDALTGLFNKRYFEKMMEIRDENKKPYALFYMDLDLFKPVNDTYGHEMGDKVLKEVAKRLLKCIRSNDYAFRIGGDEFMLILNGNLDAQICEKRIERIKKLIGEPYEFDGYTIKIGISCGSAVYPDDANCAADIQKLADIAHSHNIPLVIDSTFATPYLLRPIEYGADIVVHSATKFIGGHGTTLGGVIVDSGNFDWKASGKYPQIADPNPSYHGVSFQEAAGPAAFVTYIRAIILRDTGATISPFNAFLLLQGLETLSLRVERHVENTKKVIEYLVNNPKVEKVNHPSVDSRYKELYNKYFPNGAGSIFTFEIKGGEAEAKKFIDSLKIFSILANVADVKSLVIHPATTTHSQLSPEELAEQDIKPNTIRLSIGTEHIDDIIHDLDEAFAAID